MLIISLLSQYAISQNLPNLDKLNSFYDCGPEYKIQQIVNLNRSEFVRYDCDRNVYFNTGRCQWNDGWRMHPSEFGDGLCQNTYQQTTYMSDQFPTSSSYQLTNTCGVFIDLKNTNQNVIVLTFLATAKRYECKKINLVLQ